MFRLPPHSGAARICVELNPGNWPNPHHQALEEMWETGLVQFLQPVSTLTLPNLQNSKRCEFYVDMSEPGWPQATLKPKERTWHLGLTFLLEDGPNPYLLNHAHTASTGIRADVDFVQKNHFFCIHSTQKSLRQWLQANLAKHVKEGLIESSSPAQRYLASKNFETEFRKSWQDPQMCQAWLTSLAHTPGIWGLKGCMALPQAPKEAPRPYFVVFEEGKEHQMLTP